MKERKPIMETMEPIKGSDFEIQILRDQHQEDQEKLKAAMAMMKRARDELVRLNAIIDKVRVTLDG